MPILGEKLGIHRIFAIVVGFIGVLIIVKPGTDLFYLKSLLPIGSAFFMAAVYLSTRSLMNTETSTSIVFYYSFALHFTSIIYFTADIIMPDALNLTLALRLRVKGSFDHYFMQIIDHEDFWEEKDHFYFVKRK